MQSQGLENPIQISLHHSHRLSGFVPDAMNVKPSKGRILLTAVIGDSPSSVGRSGVFCEGLKPSVFAKGNPGNPGRLGMGLCWVDFCSSKHVSECLLGLSGPNWCYLFKSVKCGHKCQWTLVGRVCCFNAVFFRTLSLSLIEP